MSSKTETNEGTTQTGIPTFIPPQYVAGTQPFLYVPQFEPLNVGMNNFETHPFVSSQAENASSGCKRWGGCQRWKANSCCWKDDGRALGTFQNFVVTLLLGTASPFLSILLMYGMETSKLSRNGVLFGTANALLLGSAFLLSQSRQASHEPLPLTPGATMEGPHHQTVQVLQEHEQPHIPTWAIITLFVLGLVMLVAAVKSFRRFLYIYGTRQNKTQEETVKVISQKGTCGEFMATFFVSLLFPFIGAFISIIVRRRYLYGRYGALSGFGFAFVATGVAFSFMGCCPAPVVLFLGLIIMELSMVHFRRALMCAETPQTVA